ncbi:MAG: DNA gyrase inhibitor YacG [Proteobacteria bacterium]|nr:DNA gyrase inhibitor YacG [Pseudomonadota bacterium]
MTTPARKCPSCGRSFRPIAGDPWRPFCSDRCRLIDLGAWLSERHSIPGEDAVPDPDSPPQGDLE